MIHKKAINGTVVQLYLIIYFSVFMIPINNSELIRLLGIIYLFDVPRTSCWAFACVTCSKRRTRCLRGCRSGMTV